MHTLRRGKVKFSLQLLWKCQICLLKCIQHWRRLLYFEHIVCRHRDVLPQLHAMMYTPSILKSLSLFPDFFVPKRLSGYLPGYKLRLKVKYFHTKPSISRSLSTPQLPWAFRSSCCSLFLKLYLQVFSQWSMGLNLAQVRNKNNHLGTKGVPLKERHLTKYSDKARSTRDTHSLAYMWVEFGITLFFQL